MKLILRFVEQIGGDLKLFPVRTAIGRALPLYSVLPGLGPMKHGGYRPKDKTNVSGG